MNTYKVTDMKIFDNPQSNLLGVATVIVNDCFALNNIKIVNDGRTNQPFVAMPSYADKEGKYHDRVFPVTSEDRDAMFGKVLESYNEKKIEIKNIANVATDIIAKVYINTRPEIPILGNASITIGDGIAIQGVKIMENSKTKEPFVSFPADEIGEGDDKTYKEIAHPVTAAMRDKIIETVMGEYSKELEKINAIAKQGQEQMNEKAPTKSKDKKAKEAEVEPDEPER